MSNVEDEVRILHVYPSGRSVWLYRDACRSCGEVRYVKKSRIGTLCKRCGSAKGGSSTRGMPGPNRGRRFSELSRAKMSAARSGKSPSNKGSSHSPETRSKISAAKRGKSPWNKGVPMSYEQRVKISCSARDIDISQFDELQTPRSKAERDKLADMQLAKMCFERHDYTCDCCGARGTRLHAHHKNSWKFFPEQRFDVENLVALCERCHKLFHKTYGSGKLEPNTAEQYLEFKSTFSSRR